MQSRRSEANLSQLARVPTIVAMLVGLTAGCASVPEPRQAPRDEGLPAAFPAPDSPWERFVIREGTLTERSRFTGAVESLNRTSVTSPVTGAMVVNPPLDGTKVKKGDLLFAVSPTPEVMAAAVELEAARLSLAAYGFSMERMLRVMSAEQAARSYGLPTDSRASRPLPQMFEVKAPKAGVVVSVRRLTAPIPSGTAILEIADDSNLVIRAQVETSLAEFMGTGMEVSIRQRNSTRDPTTGSVSKIGLGDTDTRVWVTIEFDNTRFALGDDIQIEFETVTAEGVLFVPSAAIVSFDSEDYLLIDTGSGLRRVIVRKGLTTAEGVEIIGGVERGQIGIIP